MMTITVPNIENNNSKKNDDNTSNSSNNFLKTLQL